MHDVLDWLHALPLGPMFLMCFLGTLLAALLITFLVRLTLRWFDYGEGAPLPLRDAVFSTASAMFALMIAFSAAGIWNEANQARAAVQREANALENVRSVAASFSPALHDRVITDVNGYARQVLDVDWPAMVRKVHFTDTLYDKSEKILVELIAAVSREASTPGGLASTAIGQIVEVRNARLQRITLATQGVTSAQWLAMFLIAAVTLAALAMLHNHDRLSQWLALAIYTGAVSAAFFVILAHDRPFIGQLSVGSQPIAQLLTHTH